MGAALLKTPEIAEQLLKGLRDIIPRKKLFTCKIRLLETPEKVSKNESSYISINHFSLFFFIYEKTLEFAQMCERTGIDALIVHARRPNERPSHSAHWEQFKVISYYEIQYN